MYLSIGGLGATEIGLILLGVVILFGAKKLPGLARAMGSSITQFKKGLKDEVKPDELEGGADPDEAESEDSTSGEGGV